MELDHPSPETWHLLDEAELASFIEDRAEAQIPAIGSAANLATE
jgi:hypothetical protein